jgi:isopentenyl-diphosphate Delta-isomerase
MKQEVILVDPYDNQTGTIEKLMAHRLGLLHRAFSVFIFNQKGELLLQRRAEVKYHSPLLWSNTCCSHPSPGENTIESAEKRLMEEMGISCRLKKAFEFLYKEDVGSSLIEHEYDHVFVGVSDRDPSPNPSEVESFRWIDTGSLKRDMEERPEIYSKWFLACRLRIDELKEIAAAMA